MKMMLLVAMVTVAGCESDGSLRLPQPQCSVSFGSAQSNVVQVQIDGTSDGECVVQEDGQMTMTTKDLSFTVGNDFVEIHDKSTGFDCFTPAKPVYYSSGGWTFDVQCGTKRVIGSSYWRR